MAKATFNDPLAYQKQQQREARAIRAELVRQSRTPEGQIRLQLEQTQSKIDELNRQRGAQALQDSLKIQAANPSIPAAVAFNMAAKGL